MYTQDQPQLLDLTSLKGAGPKVTEKLSRLGIHDTADLLFHFPSAYQDRSNVVSLHAVQPGTTVTVQGQIELVSVVFSGRRNLVVRISDGTGFLDLRFFHFSNAQKARLQKGTTLRCFGSVRKGRNTFEMVHPEYQYVSDNAKPVELKHLTPVYPLTEGVNQGLLRRLTEQAIERLGYEGYPVADILPSSYIERYNYPPLKQALAQIHRPELDSDVSTLLAGQHPAKERLVFEELLAHHLALRLKRHAHKRFNTFVMKKDRSSINQVISQLEFTLTSGQVQAIEDIITDLSSGAPMGRLIQGDVGCGKTLVAALAAAHVVANAYQVALMAPTEILAEQLYAGLNQILQPNSTNITLLTGSTKAREKRDILAALENGNINILIGTHALFQDDIRFKELGLVIIDEQHRFGVHQRLSLKNKGVQGNKVPHQLIMTATPIPRTLTMTFYADLDCSVIKDMPAGRKPIDTLVMPEGRRHELINKISGFVENGQQVFWVCPLIEESDILQCQAAEDTFAMLNQLLPTCRIGLVHGRLSPREKETVMDAFRANELNVLVATTVIEVGVNVPNATLMVIENAERMGLSQLHQLRGRVGRGSEQGSCVLMYRAPLSRNAQQRLAVMRETNDGFRIAEKDLEIRGPGDLLGTRQTGELLFKIADLQKHQYLLPRVQKSAVELEQKRPELVSPLIQRWCANAIQYGQV